MISPRMWREFVLRYTRKISPGIVLVGNTDEADRNLDGVLLEDDGAFKKLGTVVCLGLFATQKTIGKGIPQRWNIAMAWGAEHNLDGLALDGEFLPRYQGDNVTNPTEENFGDD